MTIKSQVLADFITEWTEVQMPPAVVDQEYWMMYFNGSLMKMGASVGLVFVSPLGVRMRYMVRLHFPSSNNVAEYEAFINGLGITIELGIRRLDIRGDSQLVVNQVMKESSCHDYKMGRTTKKSDGWRTDSIALNSITSQGTSTKRPTRLRKQCPAES